MGRERQGKRDERRSGNPSTGLSGEEGVMMDVPMIHREKRDEGRLETYRRERETEEVRKVKEEDKKRDDGQYLVVIFCMKQG